MSFSIGPLLREFQWQHKDRWQAATWRALCMH